MKRIVFLLVINLLVLTVFAQVQVYPAGHLPDQSKLVKGSIVTYALPTTTLKMTVSVSKVQDVRGYFADYAESLLGLTNIIQQNRTYYTLNSVDVEPITTADMSQCYHVFSTNPATIASWEEMRLANPVLFPETTPTSYQTHAASLPDFFKNYADISYTQQSEAFVETKIIDGVVTQVPASHTKTVSKSFENKAREAADAIMKSRKAQYNLVAGEQETPYSGEAIQTMLAELKNWENNYMSLFTGVSIADTLVYVVYCTPKSSTSDPIFYFNTDKGFNQENGLTSDAYVLNLDFVYSTASFVMDAMPVYNINGICVRNPVPMTVKLMHNNKTLQNFGVINMYQFGDIHHFDPSSKKPIDISKIGFIF